MSKKPKPVIIRRGILAFISKGQSGKEFMAQVALGLIHRFHCYSRMYVWDKNTEIPDDYKTVHTYVWAENKTEARKLFAEHISKMQKDPNCPLSEKAYYEVICVIQQN